MNAKHRRTLEAIFARPVPSDIRWMEIEALLVALGADRSEGRGSPGPVPAQWRGSDFSSPAPEAGNEQGGGRVGSRILENGGYRAVTTMMHDGYLAELEIDEGVGVIHGRVINARAVLTFEGETLAELKAAFADTIADYRAWCKERGTEPEKPYSGTLSLRIAPELHRRVAEQAAKAGESINQFIAERLEEVA